MKRTHYKIALLIVFISTSLIAQNHSRTYNEEFNTNSDVVIDVNTRYTDVQIETWNENKVSIEAVIEIEGAEDGRAEKALDNWQFKAIGNKSEVEILSKSNSANNYLFPSTRVSKVIVNGKLIEDSGSGMVLDFPEVDLHSLNDELHYLSNILVLPEVDELNATLNFDFLFDHKLPKFDYEKYKKDKGYLKKWQKEMKENLEKNKIKWLKEAEKVKKHKAVLKVELKKMAEERKKQAELQKKTLTKHIEMRMKQAELQRKNQIIIRNKQLAERNADVNKKRIIINGVLADREKIKVKRTIIIKAPKDAKFKMNVKYGTISFPN